MKSKLFTRKGNCGGGCPGGLSIYDSKIVGKDPYCNYYKEMLEYVVDTIPLLHKAGKVEQVLDGK